MTPPKGVNVHYIDVSGLSKKEAQAKVDEYVSHFKKPIIVWPYGG